MSLFADKLVTKVIIMPKINIILAAYFLLLLFVIPNANADTVKIGGVLRIMSGGSLVFPDGTTQYSATVQGPKGDKGDTGAAGPPGLPGQPVTGFEQLNYYALGDSITYGSGSSSGNYSYADALNAKLNFSSFTKLGVSGATVMPTSGRSELTTQVFAIGDNADIITVLIGVNDYAVNNPVGNIDDVLSKSYASLNKSLSFTEAFRYCLETIKKYHEQSRIYVILPLQTSIVGQLEPLDQFRVAEIKIANYLSIPVIYANTESGLWTGGTVFPDGLHPNDSGHAMLANYLARKISSL